jgi:hypothetical protein
VPQDLLQAHHVARALSVEAGKGRPEGVDHHFGRGVIGRQPGALDGLAESLIDVSNPAPDLSRGLQPARVRPEWARTSYTSLFSGTMRGFFDLVVRPSSVMVPRLRSISPTAT